MKPRTFLQIIARMIAFVICVIPEDTLGTDAQDFLRKPIWEDLLDDVLEPTLPHGAGEELSNGMTMRFYRGVFPPEAQRKHDLAKAAIRQDVNASQRLLEMLQRAHATNWHTGNQVVRGFYALGSLGKPAIPELTRMLEDSSKRLHAVRALWAIGPDAVDSLIAGTTNQNVLVRLTAVDGLGNTHLRTAMPTIFQCLDDTNIAVKCAAAEALWRNGMEREAVVAALTAHLSSDNAQMRKASIVALGFCGEAAAPAIPQLQLALDDPAVRDRAAWALDLVGPKAIPALISGLTNDSHIVRSISVQRLGQYGTNGMAGTPLVIHCLLHDTNSTIRMLAATALAGLKTSAELAMPLLMKALEDENAHVRRAAIEAIDRSYRNAPEAKAAIPALLRLLEDKSCRSLALGALRALDAKVDESKLHW